MDEKVENRGKTNIFPIFCPTWAPDDPVTPFFAQVSFVEALLTTNSNVVWQSSPWLAKKIQKSAMNSATIAHSDCVHFPCENWFSWDRYMWYFYHWIQIHNGTFDQGLEYSWLSWRSICQILILKMQSCEIQKSQLQNYLISLGLWKQMSLTSTLQSLQPNISTSRISTA